MQQAMTFNVSFGFRQIRALLVKTLFQTLTGIEVLMAAFASTLVMRRRTQRTSLFSSFFRLYTAEQFVLTHELHSPSWLYSTPEPLSGLNAKYAPLAVHIFYKKGYSKFHFYLNS